MLPAALGSLLVLLLANAPQPALSWFPGVEQRFVDEKLISAGSLGLPNDGMIAAWADYSSDQLTDLFYLSADQRTVSVYAWDRKAYIYRLVNGTEIKTSSDFIITNVIPNDLDYDGKLDVLLMGQKNPNDWWGSEDALQMQAYLQQPDAMPHSVDSARVAQPIAFDATGDMRTDLLGMNAQSGKLQLWKNVWSSANRSSAIFEAAPPPFDASSFDCDFADPHYNAYVDLDGDCLADLFFVCKDRDTALSYQIWHNDKSEGFKLARMGPLPKGTQSVGFGDMDRDGTIDMVLTVCTNKEACSIAIAYNRQVELCSSSTPVDTPCRDSEALCVGDDDFQFSFDQSTGDYTVVPVAALMKGTLATSSTRFRGTLPVPPAIGDFNIDGFPDLLVVNDVNRMHKAVLLESRPCDKTSCSEKEIANSRRAFRVVTKGAEVLDKLTDVESAHWIDIDDDGSLDIVLQRRGSSGAARTQTFIKNNYFHDAFFLKAIVLNGACEGWCEPEDRDQPRYKPYGVSYSGASFKFTVLDPTGARKAAQVGQLPRTSYLSLLTPYSYFGLGRTNNYVENLFVGSTRQQKVHFTNIEGLIPNSQVVLNPFQPDDVRDPSTWTKELFLHPGDWIPWVTIALGATIMILGVVVLVLHINEKREDEAERKARLLHLNFGAL